MLTVDDLQIDPGTVAATAAPNGIQDFGTTTAVPNEIQDSRIVPSGLQVRFLGGVTVDRSLTSYR